MTLSGVLVALTTPFTDDGRLDLPALEAHLDLVLDGGVSGLVPCGTTGEAPTLDGEEWEAVVRTTVEGADGRVPVVAGTGGNATAKTVKLTARAQELGADAALVVAPYYNKPSQRGLEAHFRAVAEVGLPVVIYNIPSRTGVNVVPETVAALAEEPGIVGIKEASGDLRQAAEVRRRTADDFALLSGDDALTLPMLAVGGQGVVSVVANLLPDRMVALVRAWETGNREEALREHLDLLPLMEDLFIETNPVPVKAALALLGRMSAGVRPPLAGLQAVSEERLRARLESMGLL